MARDDLRESGTPAKADAPGTARTSGAGRAPTLAGAVAPEDLLAGVATGIAVLDGGGQLVLANPRARDLLGLERTARSGPLLPRRWQGSIADEHGAAVDRDGWPLSAFARGESASRLFRVRHASRQRETTVEVTVDRLTRAGVAQTTVVTLVDRTALAEAHEKLCRAEADRATLLRAVPDTFISVGADDRITRIDGGGGHARPGGRLTREAVGKRVWELFEGEAAGVARQALSLARATGRPVTTELTQKSPSGGHHEEARHVPLPDGALFVSLRDITERKRTEEALASSEEQFRTLYTRTPVMLHSIDAEGRLVSVSDRWLDRLGYTADEVLGHSSTEFLTVESRRLAAEQILPEFFRTGACTDVPYQFVAKSGEVVEVLLSATAERDDKGAVSRSLAVLVDVSAQRAAEQEVARQEEALRAAVDQAPTLLWTVDTDLRFTSARGGGREALGLVADDVTGMTVESYFGLPEPGNPAIAGHLRALAGETSSYEMEFCGRVYATLLEPLRDRSGAIVGAVGVAHDITEARRTRDSLRDREQMLSGLVGSLPGVAYRSTVDSPWHTTFISDGCLELTGYSAAEITGGVVSWEGLMQPDDLRDVLTELGRDLEAGADITVSEYRIVDREGAERWILDRATLLRDREGSPRELIGLLIDITERRATEQALAERESQLRALLANIPGMAYRCQPEAPWRDEFIGAACFDMTGYTPQQLISGDPVWEDIMEPADHARLVRETEAAIDERRPGELEYRVHTASGQVRWIWDRFHVTRDENDEPVALEGLMLDVTARHTAEEESQRLRLHDATTGLPNRFLFTDRIAQELAHARRRRLGFAVAVIALDRFHTLVETLGHEACDRLLEAVAQRLTESVRGEDSVACLAGSEFGVLLPGVSGPGQASAGVAHLTGTFAHPFQVDAHELFLTLSAGIALYPADGAEASELLEHAEVAARRVSSEGGNGWQFFRRGMNDEHAGRLALEGELHRALERDQFDVYYQPVVDARSGAMTGAEGLLRWRRSGGGVATPDQFMDVLEEAGLSIPVGVWVIGEVCTQAQAWRTAVGAPLRFAVNLSARQLYDDTLLDAVAEALSASGLPPDALSLEITETTAMRDPDLAARIVTALNRKGVHVALDDFGTGYSSLSHLVRLPIDTVKIDRSFVRDILTVPEHAAVATSVIALGHRLGMTVVAEGVETPEERDYLRAEGCDGLQGYLFSRPVPAADFERLLAREPLD